MAIIEKRKERRIKVNLPIKITYQNNLEVVGRIGNISRLGAYAEIDREISPGTELDITLEIPKYSEDLSQSGEIRCKATVFRCNLVREAESKKYYGLGIFFTNFLRQIDRDKLSKYIDFLILKEGETIREGVKRWQDKRKLTKITKQSEQIKIKQKDYQIEIVDLLKQILNQLKEISHLLRLQNKTK